MAQMPTKVKERSLYYAIASLLAGFALSVYYRPNFPTLFPLYGAFEEVMPFVWWGWSAITISIWMLLSRPGGLNSMASTMCSSIWFALAATAFGARNGFYSAVAIYTLLSLWSLWLFSVELEMYIEASPITKYVVNFVKRRLP